MHSCIVDRGGHKILGRYKNGNYFVEIWDDGTKIRIQPNDDADFIPAFAENCDVKITDQCDGGCPFCYEGCTKEGKHGEFLNLPLWDTLHPYTELAINGNDLSHPQLTDFLTLMKKKNIIVNMTVNQKHFKQHYNLLCKLSDNELIHGIGISLVDPDPYFISMVSKAFPNAVIHTINGITTPEQYRAMYDKELKILILGYKMRGRGEKYLLDHLPNITANMMWLQKNLKDMADHFQVMSFDNLALTQLRVKESGILTPDQWNEFYMGDDGNYTFYIDLVKKEFAKNSVSDKRYPLLNNIDDMFNKVRTA